MDKITVLGDIMVEPPFMEQVAQQGAYDFKPSFAPLKALLKDSDYVIGNLETPLAGEEAGYTNRIVSFNSPDSLLDALIDLGVDAVSTVNNHCLDRGLAGLERTLQVLDQYGIAHTGTYAKDFSGERIHYFTVGDTKIALIAYTYATNATINNVYLDDSNRHCVNLLRPQAGAPSLYEKMPANYYDTLAYLEELAGRKLIWEETIKLKIAMHIPVPTIDDIVDEQEQDEWFKRIEADYHEAREKADIVLFYPHAGGQFNETPGKYTKRLVEKSAQLGFDAVFAAHSHTSHRAEFLNNKACFYSMGNVSMSPGTFYSVSSCLPEYGLAAHLYLEDKKVSKVTFSIFKMVEEGNDPMRVVPVDDLYAQLSGEAKEKLLADVSSVYRRVTCCEHNWSAPCKEYDLI